MRCLIVDDNRGFLETARKVLESGGMTVVGVATSSPEALRRTEETDPDVVLVDIALASESGIELARLLTTRARPKIVLISTHGEDDFADLIAESPAIGFLPKWRLSARAVDDLVSGRPSDQRASR
jgi:CheY-like chemotaxis protein